MNNNCVNKYIPQTYKHILSKNIQQLDNNGNHIIYYILKNKYINSYIEIGFLISVNSIKTDNVITEHFVFSNNNKLLYSDKINIYIKI